MATKIDIQVLLNEFKAAIQEMGGNIGRPIFKGIMPSENGTPTAISHTTKQSLGIEKTFQQHLNHIATLSFPDDKEDYIFKIQEATNLSEKQKELLVTNIKNSRF